MALWHALAPLLVATVLALYLRSPPSSPPTTTTTTTTTTLRNRRICLLIAHPDDEAMFFAPTLLALTRPSTGNHVKILCLSSGDANGLGSRRKRELVRSGVLLGLRDEEDVFVVDNPSDFPDSMTTEWPADKIASLLASAFTSSASDAPTIDVLITFDRHGVSSHPNHISLYHGATTFVASAPSVDLYALESVNVLRKYISFFDLFLSPFFLSFFPSSAVEVDKEGKGEVGQAHPRRLLFVSRFDGFVAARRAMVNAHRSQMVWFRHLYILFSRYMVVNDLRLERVPPVQR